MPAATLRADAVDEAWRIGDRGAPSPRALAALLDGWARQVERWAAELLLEARRDAGDQVGAIAARLAVLAARQPPPEPPDLRQWAAVGRPSVRAAVRAELRVLRAAGMPKGWLEQRLVAPPGRPPVLGRRADQQDRDPVRPAIEALGAPGGPTRGINLLTAGPGEAVLRTWAETGRGLIRTLSESATRELPALVVEAAASGGRWEDLVDAVERMGARTRAHARLIARDQVARANSAVTQELQTQAGLTHYKWEHSGDERVRESHRAAATRDVGHGPGVYSWAEGAPGVGFYGEAAHPGAAGQCRCRARPVLPPSARAAWAREAAGAPAVPVRPQAPATPVAGVGSGRRTRQDPPRGERLEPVLGEAVDDPAVPKQVHENACGASAAAMLAKDRGVTLDHVALAAQIDTDAQAAARGHRVFAGVTGETMTQWLKGTSGTWKTGRIVPEQRRTQLQGARKSWVALLGPPKDGHWVVVDGLAPDGRVIVRDPAGRFSDSTVGARRLVPPEEFLDAWNGWTVLDQD